MSKTTAKERQLKETQKKLLKQREEARAAQAAAESERDRLRGDIEVRAGEHVVVLKREYEASVNEVKRELEKVKAEKLALETNLDAAISAKIDALLKDKVLLEHENKLAAQALLAEEQVQIALQNDLVASKEEATALSNRVTALEAEMAQKVSALQAELATAKMEDAKTLRKRLHSKTEKVQELEKENVRLHKLVRVLGSLPEVQVRLKAIEEQAKLQPAPEATTAAPPDTQPTEIGCPHGRSPGTPCPHCLGINDGVQSPSAEVTATP
jgi:hypothetical protein